MKKISAAILLLLFCTSILSGQEMQTDDQGFKKNQFGVSIGIDRGLLKDLNYSPLNYSEKGNLYRLDYRRGIPHVKFSVQAQYSTGVIQTDASSAFDTDYQKGFLALDFWKNIKQPNSRNSLRWGLGYHFYIYYVDWGNQDAFSFLANHSINGNISVYRKISDRHALEAKLSIPVLSFLVRPPYAGLDEELSTNQDSPVKLITDGSLTSLHEMFEYTLDLSYFYKLSNRFLLQTNYSNRYQNVSEIKKIKHLQHQLSIGTTFKF